MVSANGSRDHRKCFNRIKDKSKQVLKRRQPRDSPEATRDEVAILRKTLKNIFQMCLNTVDKPLSRDHLSFGQCYF